jgi:DNA-binding response OmpR family regulator
VRENLPSAPPPPARGPKVLVIDDDRMVLLSTRLVLEASGCKVFVCDRGAQAVNVARQDPPDVILLDLMMPVTDGWETLGLLRADETTQRTPVVVFTAREHQRGHRLAREMGADDYVQKPFDAGRLVARLRELAAAAPREMP